MRRKKFLWVTICIALTIAFSSCGVVELTDEEVDLVAEYSAAKLLQTTEGYHKKEILSVEQQEEPNIPSVTEVPDTVTPATSEAPNAEPTSDVDPAEPKETPGIQVSLNEIYHLNEIDIKYSSYQFCKEYPKNSEAYQITASEDELLLVVKFNVTNTYGKGKKIDLINRWISYTLTADESQYNPSISVLKNGGLNFLNTKLKAGKTEEAVLIYALPKKVRDATSLTIKVQEADKESTVQVR